MGEWKGRSPQKADSKQNTTRKPNKVIVVPKEYQRATLARERDLNIHIWKTETDCDVIPRWDNFSSKITCFEIFGTGTNLEKAIREINQWIEKAPTKTKESTAWAKMPAFFHDKWYDEHMREEQSKRKEMFKGPVPEGMDVPFKIVITWPDDLREAGVIPKDVFGGNLQGLDPVRVDDEVFINPIDLSDVQIQGFELAHVESAEQHYLTMIQKARMKTFGATHSLQILLDEVEGIEVLLEQVPHWWPDRTTHKVVPRLLPSPMMNEPGDFRQDGLHFTQLSVIQQALQLALEAVRYEKGSYNFCIRFGCLGLSSKKLDLKVGQKTPKDGFMKAIQGLVQCDTRKWIMPDEEGDELLARFVAAEHLLEPVKSAAGWFGHTPETLGDIRPMFRGTWVFKDPNAPRIVESQTPNRHPGRPDTRGQPTKGDTNTPPPLPLYVVQIDWTDDEEGMYENMGPKYYALQPGHAGPKENIDIKLLELGGGKAWQFSLESMKPVAKKLVSPVLRAFAEKVQMTPDYNIHSKTKFATWTNSPMLPLQTGRLEKIYTFGIKKTLYRVELVGMWYPESPYPCWGVNVRHSEWATHLVQLEHLQTGHCADWGLDTIAAFLPDDGVSSSVTQDDLLDIQNLGLSSSIEAPPRDGIRLLMDKLMELSTVINQPSATPNRTREAVEAIPPIVHQ